jgi:hypothetical protein
VYLACLPKQGAASDGTIDTHLESHLTDPMLLRSDDFYGFVGHRQEALLGLIEAATGRPIYRGAAMDEPVEEMVEDEVEGLEAAEQAADLFDVCRLRLSRGIRLLCLLPQ